MGHAGSGLPYVQIAAQNVMNLDKQAQQKRKVLILIVMLKLYEIVVAAVIQAVDVAVDWKMFLMSFFQYVPPPPAKFFRAKPKQAGKKEGGLGEGIFARLLTAPTCPPKPRRRQKARQGWEAARPCVSRETKPAKIVSLIEKEFCARPLKEKEIFAGFVRRQAASRWGRFLPVRAEILAQKRFERRSVIATNSKLPRKRRFCV